MKQLNALLFLFCVGLSPALFAQEAIPETVNLEQAIAYALQNNIDAKNATLDEKIAKARVNETRGIGLPQVNASASVIHNQKLARFFTTYDPNGGFIDFGGNPPSGLDAGEVIAVENIFQLRSIGSVGLTINQILFNASYLVGLRAANTYKSLAEKQAQQTREQIIQSVTTAYYGAIINRERLKAFDANITRIDSLFANTKALLQNGFVEEIDLDRIEVAMNNLKTERKNFENLQLLSVELLKFQMNYPMERTLNISQSAADLVIVRDVEGMGETFEYNNRIEYSILETSRDLQKLNIQNNYSAGLPNLVAFADLGYNTQSPNIGGIFRTNSSFPETAALGRDKWYSTSSFGVSLNIPIFSGLQRNYKIQQEKLASMKIENSFTSLKQGIDLQIKQGKISYENALNSLDNQSRNLKLAEKIARVTKVKYQQGVGSNLEVVEAESSYREAQVNYYNALYDAMVSRVDLLKAYGKINTLTSN
ncbi:MAG: TolC family protein [Chryseotalea sp.]